MAGAGSPADADVADALLFRLQQGGAADGVPIVARESAVRSIRAAFAQPGALEETVHHTIGDMPGRQLLVQLVAGCVARSWDLALPSSWT